jgi:hypothetical protein
MLYGAEYHYEKCLVIIICDGTHTSSLAFFLLELAIWLEQKGKEVLN